MVPFARALSFSRPGHAVLSLLLITGCRSGYELLEAAAVDPVGEEVMGGAPGSGGDHDATGGSSSGGAPLSSGGAPRGPSGGSGGQSPMGGAPGSGGFGMGGDSSMGGDSGLPTSCTTVIADSVLDFSDVQGQAGWTYGYFLPPNFAPGDFIPMTSYGPIDNLAEDGWFVSSDYWTAISATKMHPNGATTTAPKLGEEQHTARRFTSTESGALFVQGSFHSYDGSFNGTRGYILVEGQQTFEIFAPPGQTEAAPFETVISVNAGDRVDFVLDPFEGADHADSTQFMVQICR